jgi:hypothetical protein
MGAHASRRDNPLFMVAIAVVVGLLGAVGDSLVIAGSSEALDTLEKLATAAVDA